MNKKIFILCGELSAEQYAAKLVPELKNRGFDIYALGGELLKQAGAEEKQLFYGALKTISPLQ